MLEAVMGFGNKLDNNCTPLIVKIISGSVGKERTVFFSSYIYIFSSTILIHIKLFYYTSSSCYKHTLHVQVMKFWICVVMILELILMQFDCHNKTQHPNRTNSSIYILVKVVQTMDINVIKEKYITELFT